MHAYFFKKKVSYTEFRSKNLQIKYTVKYPKNNMREKLVILVEYQNKRDLNKGD
jgi:hypothetical protein